MTKKKNSKTVAHFNLTNVFILLAYGFVAVLTPNLKALDSNGPKFLALALLNLLVIAYFIYDANKKKNFSIFIKLFTTKVGIAYSLLIFVSLLSFVKSININESIVHFSKICTTFTATWLVSIILLKDRSALKYLAIAMTIFLAYDSIRVFFGVNDYIEGNLETIDLLKAGYSNKNILTAALFIKIPFALWLVSFNKGFIRQGAMLSVFLAILALLFLSSRTFYLGLIFLSIVYIFFLLFSFYQSKNKSSLKIIGFYIFSLLFSFLIHSAVQGHMYPKDTTRTNINVTGKLATIGDTKDESQNVRLENWRWSIDFIKDNPMLGIGLGNWKLRILERDNLKKTGFGYKYKAHNDFFETAAETGIIGGLLFISIFAILIFSFVLTFFKNTNAEKIKYYFLPAFGLIAYFFDAFFNFPQDRPEIQGLFALYVGIGIALTSHFSKDQNIERNTKKLPSSSKLSNKLIVLIPVISISVVIASIYILNLNFKSLKLQTINWSETNNNKNLISYKDFEKQLPKIPDISVVGEPIMALKLRKLLIEKRYEKMLEVFKDGNPSPFDSRPEYYAALAHYHLNNNDSAMFYIKKAYKIKPQYYNTNIYYANILERFGKDKEAITLLDTFLSKVKTNVKIWQYNASLNGKIGNKQRAATVIDSALVYFPKDSKLQQLGFLYKSQAAKLKTPNLFKAIEHYNDKNYSEAIKYFELCEEDFKLVGNDESYVLYLNQWANSYFNINNFKKSKEIFERSAEIDAKNYYALMNLGLIQFQYKNYKKANEYFSSCLQSEKPNLFLTYKNLGTSYLILKRNDEAIESYENALKYGTAPDILKNLYLLWIDKGNTEKAAYYKNL